jgi:peptidoglycan hydrolase CwlO-like protein
MNYNEDFETEEDFEEMEMPTPCQKCGGWFDLNDGTASEKWFPRTVICSDCGEKEQNIIEIEQDIVDLQDEIDQAKDSISSANETISENTAKIQDLQEKLKVLEED